MWRALETGARQVLNGHERGKPRHKPRKSLPATAPVVDPTKPNVSNVRSPKLICAGKHYVRSQIRIDFPPVIGIPCTHELALANTEQIVFAHQSIHAHTAASAS